jgi:hypothetical protein
MVTAWRVAAYAASQFMLGSSFRSGSFSPFAECLLPEKNGISNATSLGSELITAPVDRSAAR